MREINWDTHYQSGTPPWETGQPSLELARVIAEEKIKPCRVIDIGCGSGINAVWLAQQGFDVTGVDITPLAIEKARARAAASGVQVRFVEDDVLDLREKYEPFPFFFDRGCYHSVRDPGAAVFLRTLERITAPGSIGLVLTGNAKEPPPEGQGPPVVSEEQIRAELGSLFEIVRLREFRFDTSMADNAAPLAWSCLLRRAAQRK
jgi:2-polyprenyl-3-methyl-5-hydroxy-6-metoxy-1,4-benzoquinol methylase